MIDFTKVGKVGDRVKHPMYGEGIIGSINCEGRFPLKVSFPVGNIYFTSQGTLFKAEKSSCLYFANGSITVDQGTPPERKWIPTEVTWGKAWDYSDEYNEERFTKGWIVGYNPNYNFPFLLENGSLYKHAEPCDLPKWIADYD